ncbi:MAG: hypothetical protein LBI03_10040 [Clostridiales bacterium]|jgi:hypothetical protein|nr:hypothetical protein [Clostridiales bacterium]
MNAKEKCVDCLHCKVSAKSVPDFRLCYCSQKKNKTTYKEIYWLKKTACGKFVNMSENSNLLTVLQTSKGNDRKLLLKGKAYER